MRRELAVWMAAVGLAAVAASAGWQPPENPVRKAEAARAREAAMLRSAVGMASWAPDPEPLHFDVEAYDLDLLFDFQRERIAGVVTVELSVLEDGLDSLELDADAGLRVAAVWLEEQESRPGEPPRELSFEHGGHRLLIGLGRPFAAGEALRLAVAYAGRASRVGDGVTWTTLGGSTPSATTMAEPFGARVWVPCQDRPDDKALWTLRITAPAELVVGANGVRVGRLENPDGTATTVWESRYPMATYLVVVDISDYRVIEDLYTGLDGAAAMPVQTWAYPWNVDLARQKFAATPSLLGLLAGHFGEYPFLDEKYGNCLAPIWAGGMEHQTFTSVAGGTGPDDNGVLDGESVAYLDVHEAAHQWWGDWVSPATWKDLWLNESFASYAEFLLAEAGGSLAGYMAREDWKGWFSGPLYDNPVAFSVTVYDKGARVLRMLEQLLGREGFEAALAVWRERFGGWSATTEDLRGVLEDVSGMDLSWFFQQWVYGSGRPHLRWSWEGVAGPAVRLHLEQVQTNAGLFRFPLEVEVRTAAGSEIHRVEVAAEAGQTLEIPVSGTPAGVVLDPGDWLLEEAHAADEPDLDLGPGFPDDTVFPPVVVGGTATITLPVANVGGATLRVMGSRVYSSTAFQVGLPAGGLEVAPGETTELQLTFAPGSVGGHHGWIALSSNDPAGGGTTWIEVRGVGAAREGVALQAPTALDWGSPVPVGSASERLVTVTNVGTETTTVAASVPGDAFTLPGAAGFALDPGSEALVLIRFEPVLPGASVGELELGPEGGTPLGVTLTAVGVAAPRLVVDPGVVFFGWIPVDREARHPLRLENRGGESLTLAGLESSGPFVVADGPGLPTVLEPGGAVEVTILTGSADPGPLAGELRILSDDPETPIVRVPLRATVRHHGAGRRVLSPGARPAAIGS